MPAPHVPARSARHAVLEPLELRRLLSIQIDTAFAGAGSALFDRSGDDFAFASAVQADGKLVLAGTSTGPDDLQHILLARVNPDGTLDAGFGDGGFAFLALSQGSTDEVRAVAIDVAGRIVVAGYSNASGNNDFLVARFSAAGVPDSSFGIGGVLLADYSVNDQAFALALGPSGSIVLAGVTGAGGDFAVVRVTAAGAIDTAFGNAGLATFSFGSGFDAANAVAVQSDGRIVAAGYALTGSNFDFATARFNPDGTVDSDFATAGGWRMDFGHAVESANALAVLPDGSMVLAGRGAGNFLLVKLTPAGALDNSFGSSGRVYSELGGNNDRANALAVLADGRLVAAGGGGNGARTHDFAAAVYMPDGSLDTSFASGGLFRADLQSSFDEARSIAIRHNRMYLVGHSTPDLASAFSYDLAVFAFTLPQSQPEPQPEPEPEPEPQPNTPPTASIAAPSVLVRSFSSAFVASISDPDAGDTHVVTWDFGDGTTRSFAGIAEALNVAHVYARDGVYTVTLRVTDSAGATTTSSATVTVSAWALVPWGNKPNRFKLLVGGTDGNDVIRLKQDGRDRIRVIVNGTGSPRFSNVHAVEVRAGAGDDWVSVWHRPSCISAEVFGDAGNDVIKGSRGSDALHGGDGNDLLIGLDGNDRLHGDDGDDTLLGGRGNDSLYGGAGRDLLIGGHGRDKLFGGPGADTFVLRKHQHDKCDVIADFEPDDRVIRKAPKVKWRDRD